jgi:tRNA-dihydrouridine synthase
MPPAKPAVLAAGSAMLLRPNRIEEVVRSMRGVLSCPLTFKTRKGYNDGADVSMGNSRDKETMGWGDLVIRNVM